MSKNERLMKEMAEAEGLKVSSITYGRHMKVYVVRPDGVKGLVVGPRSASDYRQMQNKRADFRKFAKGAALGQNDEHIKGDPDG